MLEKSSVQSGVPAGATGTFHRGSLASAPKSERSRDTISHCEGNLPIDHDPAAEGSFCHNATSPASSAIRANTLLNDRWTLEMWKTITPPGASFDMYSASASLGVMACSGPS